MTRKYFPKLGDVVCYEDKRWVIVHKENDCIAYPVYFFYLLDENLINNCSFIKTEELFKKCIRVMWVPDKPIDEPPFTKIDVQPYKIKEISFTKINK